MIHDVAGSESSDSTETRNGHRGATDQAVTETSTSVEDSTGGFGHFISDHNLSHESNCVNVAIGLSGVEISTSYEIASTGLEDYAPTEDEHIGQQPGYDLAVTYDVNGLDLTNSTEHYTIESPSFTGSGEDLPRTFGSLTIPEAEDDENDPYTPTEPYIPVEDEGIGLQEGYELVTSHDVSGTELSLSFENYSLNRNDFPIVVQVDCKPEVFIHYNPLTEYQYNHLAESDYNVMEE